MYDIIDAKRSVRKLYTESLVGRGDITLEDAEAALKDFQSQLEKVFVETRNASASPAPEPNIEGQTPVAGGHDGDHAPRSSSGSPTRTRTRPEGFAMHPRLKPQIERRVAMASAGDVDWATAELYAFGSLVLQGRTVRLAGQDSRRGTFTQRHATLIDRETGAEYTPVRNLSADQAPFWVYDSLLSEYAAMGFEYGYSVDARGRARLLGGAVRRLRRRRADDRRRVHLLRRGQVGPALGGDPAAPPWLRGPGPGPLVGAPGTVPADGRREQHDGRDVLVAGQLLPPAACARGCRRSAGRSSRSRRSRCCG